MHGHANVMASTPTRISSTVRSGQTLSLRATNSHALRALGRHAADDLGDHIQNATGRCPEEAHPTVPVQTGDPVARRSLLAAAAGASAAAWQGWSPSPAAAEGAKSLSDRLSYEALDLRNPGQAPPWASPESKVAYFPKWMFGEWEVSNTFTRFAAPLGAKYVPDGALEASQAPAEEGGIGSTTRYNLRYFSTLPDTFENNLRVNLGLGVPSDAIIGDKSFNTRSTTNAFLGYNAVDSVAYDAFGAPDRLKLEFGRLGPDMRPLPPRRAELFINRTNTETTFNDDGESSFVVQEYYRQVMIGVRQVDTTDYEIVNQFRRLKDGLVQGRQRTLVYLQPQEQLYFQANNRAVAIYDYEFEMRRVPPPADAAEAGASACVETPKDFTQCL